MAKKTTARTLTDTEVTSTLSRPRGTGEIAWLLGVDTARARRKLYALAKKGLIELAGRMLANSGYGTDELVWRAKPKG